MKKYNILFITLVDLSGTSGQNKYSEEVASALARSENVSLHLICPEPSREISEELKQKSISLNYISSKRSGSIRWHIETKYEILTHILKINNRYSIDGIVTPLKASTILPPLVASIYKIPQVLLVEGMMTRNIKKQDPFPGATIVSDILSTINALASTHIFTAYEESNNWIKSLPFVDPSNVSVFNHGVNTDIFRPMEKSQASKQIGFDPVEPDLTIGYVGSFKKYHCVDILIESVAKLRNKIHFELLLVGEGPRKRELEQLAEQLNIRDRVTFTGYVEHDKVHKYISSCDIMYGVVDPAHWGSPMKVYEYMACGKPVITYNSKEFKIVRKKNIGLVITKTNVDCLQKKLLTLAGVEDSELKKMGNIAREYVKEDRTWDNLADQIMAKLGYS